MFQHTRYHESDKETYLKSVFNLLIHENQLLVSPQSYDMNTKVNGHFETHSYMTEKDIL